MDDEPVDDVPIPLALRKSVKPSIDPHDLRLPEEFLLRIFLTDILIVEEENEAISGLLLFANDDGSKVTTDGRFESTELIKLGSRPRL